MVSVGRLMQELPEGYEQACFEQKAIQRKRGIKEPGDLMMLSMFHLLNGCSLTEISEIARLTKLGDVSDVAFMNRFKNCNAWFRWILARLTGSEAAQYQRPEWLEKYRPYAVDASDVSEKGKSGRVYRLHFALDLFKMESLQYRITTQKTGETLKNFEIAQGDLVIADRVYGTINGMEHCLSNGGHFILRLRNKAFKLYGADEKEVDLLSCLREIPEDKVLDLCIFAYGKSGKFPIRICAKRKSPEQMQRTAKKIHRKESKKQLGFSEETKEMNNYIVLLTALPPDVKAGEILDLYRYRWQVEIYFKRLKSIIDFGEMPKRSPESVMSWLNGKLIVALLIEKIISKASFPPYGTTLSQHLA
jgi:hypothetical protein